MEKNLKNQKFNFAGISEANGIRKLRYSQYAHGTFKREPGYLKLIALPIPMMRRDAINFILDNGSDFSEDEQDFMLDKLEQFENGRPSIQSIKLGTKEHIASLPNSVFDLARCYAR